jgi:hypothetical protein
VENRLVLEVNGPDAHENSNEKYKAAARVQIVPLALQVLEKLALHLELGVIKHQL